jgi:periplasmic divalent cation tolerance protein
MSDARIVLTTLDNPESARHIACQLVELRLAACVNIIDGVHSVYRWKGQIESADELQLIIKTSAERIPELKEAIARLHPYELPELIVLDVAGGSEKYLAWMLADGDEKSKLP